jgi:hypothetical protein
MKTISEYYDELKKIIDSELSKHERDQKLIDFIYNMKNDAIKSGEERVNYIFEELNK